MATFSAIGLLAAARKAGPISAKSSTSVLDFIYTSVCFQAIARNVMIYEFLGGIIHHLVLSAGNYLENVNHVVEKNILPLALLSLVS